MESPLRHFAALIDPRVERTREHLLQEILFITIAAVLCGADSWNDIQSYGQSKQPWLATFLKLPGGIPSHDTFNRVFSAINSEELESCFEAWVRAVAKLSAGEVVSIDGKALRGSRTAGKKAIVHMVSAWASENHLVLAQRKVDDKSNEITAIPKLLKVLVLSGCVVTVDAMGCQRSIAEEIVDQQADYILAVKDNQGDLLEGVQDAFRFLPCRSVSQQVDVGHGRVETRTCSVIDDLSMIEKAHQWASLHSLMRLEAERHFKTTGQTESETRYYISSLTADAERINRAVRQHWGIENFPDDKGVAFLPSRDKYYSETNHIRTLPAAQGGIHFCLWSVRAWRYIMERRNGVHPAAIRRQGSAEKKNYSMGMIMKRSEQSAHIAMEALLSLEGLFF